VKEKIVVSVIGAGGKMGTRTTNNLAKQPDTVDLYFCETSEAGIASIKARGFKTTPAEVAVPKSEIVVLAVPDTVIKTVSVGIVKLMTPGSTMIILDPAAAVAKELALRRKSWKKPKPRYTRGVLDKYAALVNSASQGAVTDEGLD